MRRTLAALLAALALGGTVHLVVNRPAPEAVAAVVATRELPPGHRLVASDLEVRRLLPSAVPDSALTTPESAVGRALTSPLVAGEILTPLDVRTSHQVGGLPDGTVAVFVPLAEASVADTVTPPDRVDLHAPVDGAQVVDGALVVRAVRGERPGLWLAVDTSDASALAAARGADPLGAMLQVALHPTRTGG